MSDLRRWSAASRWRSLCHAGAGLCWLLQTERNARLHLAAALGVVGIASWLHVSREDWRWLIVAVAMVWTAEAMNTALEYVCDALMPARHTLIGRAKDVSAAAVLVAALGAALIGACTLLPYVL